MILGGGVGSGEECGYWLGGTRIGCGSGLDKYRFYPPSSLWAGALAAYIHVTVLHDYKFRAANILDDV